MRTPWLKIRVGLVALGRGATFEDAAALAGVHRRTLHRYRAQHGPMLCRESKVRAQSLTPVEREEIFVAVRAGLCDAVIARQIGRPRGTIGREIARNGGRENYRPHLAAERACERARRVQAGWTTRRPELWERVQEMLLEFWSPQQIAAQLRTDRPDDRDWHVSHEAIYQAIYVQAKGTLKAELVECLRTRRDRRRPHRPATKAATEARSDMVSISQRPAEIEDRAVPGHWEGDLILGKQGGSAIATIVERSTRFGFMVKLESKEAEHVAARIAQEVVRLGEFTFASLTWDQGSEMAAHAKLTMATGVAVFFADPHSPWQRGTNENWNGLARQYFPKGTDLSVHSQADLDRAAHSLNNRPRETLNWDTPALRFNQLVAITT